MKKVVLAMSGGVDSAVAAALLIEQGYEVIPVFMHNWEEDDENGECTATQDYNDVISVCTKLSLPYYSVNFAKQYKERVFSYFLEEYNAGRTPNPDVLCNREIKFGPFLDYANMLGADYVATGHYCGIKHVDGKHYLTKAHDANKDQTYFLNQLSQQQLEKVMFPLSEVDKTTVRAIANKYQLANAKKKDSTGICFIGERNFRQFLSNYLPNQSGDIVDTNGKKVGEHIGLMYYTLGQRRGLGIGGIKGEEAVGRWFVQHKDLANNVLVVSHGDESVLNSDGLFASGFNWIPEAPAKVFKCFAKFRYRQDEQSVTVEVIDDTHVKVLFDEPQRAVTAGQYVVLYDETNCLGGGVIDETFNN